MPEILVKGKTSAQKFVFSENWGRWICEEKLYVRRKDWRSNAAVGIIISKLERNLITLL